MGALSTPIAGGKPMKRTPHYHQQQAAQND